MRIIFYFSLYLYFFYNKITSNLKIQKIKKKKICKIWQTAKNLCIFFHINLEDSLDRREFPNHDEEPLGKGANGRVFGTKKTNKKGAV